MTTPRRRRRSGVLRRLPPALLPARRDHGCGTRCQAEFRHDRDLLRARLGGALW